MDSVPMENNAFSGNGIRDADHECVAFHSMDRWRRKLLVDTQNQLLHAIRGSRHVIYSPIILHHRCVDDHYQEHHGYKLGCNLGTGNAGVSVFEAVFGRRCGSWSSISSHGNIACPSPCPYLQVRGCC